MCNASICNPSPCRPLIVGAFFFTVLTLLAPTLWADEAPTAEPLAVSPLQAGPALCSPSPTADAIPMAPCKEGFCTVNQFSPGCGVVCTFNGSCQRGSNACCNYDCQCGDSTGLPAPPANACDFTEPTDCCNCPVTTFSPRFGHVCTATGSCQCDNCCEYTCSCGKSEGLPGTPANACAFDLAEDCCGDKPCTRSYCDDVGVRCTASGCGVGCCEYTCAPDFSCTGVDPIPPEAC